MHKLFNANSVYSIVYDRLLKKIWSLDQCAGYHDADGCGLQPQTVEEQLRRALSGPATEELSVVP